MSKVLEPIKILEDMSDEQADVLGVMAMTFAMHQRMTEMRHKGKGFWHRMATFDPLTNKPNTVARFKEDAKKAIDEGRPVDAANYMMMVYNLERMD